MKQLLRNFANSSLRGKTGQTIRAGIYLKGHFRSVVGLILLALISMSSSAFASHFKGGYITYNYLGEGRYEFLITGYWDKSEVGYVFPRYEGIPKIHAFPLTVSKTLLEDGETVGLQQVFQ